MAERPLTPEEEAVLAIAEEEVEAAEEPTAEEIGEEVAVEAAPVAEPSKPQIRFAEELLTTTTAPAGGKVKRGKGKKGVSKAADEAEAIIKPKKAKKTKARRPVIDEEMDDFIP